MTHPLLFYLFLPFPDNAVQQLLAGIFEKRDDEFEVAIVAIIRIGNGGVFTMVGQEIGHADRKSVVEGKSGDLGGRRIIKKGDGRTL